MSMNIQLFNFLEDSHAEIEASLATCLAEKSPLLRELPPESLKTLSEGIADCLIDLLVTGDSEVVDKIFKAMSRLPTADSSLSDDVIRLPLHLAKIISERLVEEYRQLEDQAEAVSLYVKSITAIHATAHKFSCRFLELLQEYLDERTATQNARHGELPSETLEKPGV